MTLSRCVKISNGSYNILENVFKMQMENSY